MNPGRFQVRRTRGFKPPTGGVRVCRPSIFGNPFKQGTRAERVLVFREWLANGPAGDSARTHILANLDRIRNRPLGCFCPPGEPCHADVLLEMANK